MFVKPLLFLLAFMISAAGTTLAQDELRRTFFKDAECLIDDALNSPMAQLRRLLRPLEDGRWSRGW